MNSQEFMLSEAKHPLLLYRTDSSASPQNDNRIKSYFAMYYPRT